MCLNFPTASSPSLPPSLPPSLLPSISLLVYSGLPQPPMLAGQSGPPSNMLTGYHHCEFTCVHVHCSFLHVSLCRFLRLSHGTSSQLFLLPPLFLLLSHYISIYMNTRCACVRTYTVLAITSGHLTISSQLSQLSIQCRMDGQNVSAALDDLPPPKKRDVSLAIFNILGR